MEIPKIEQACALCGAFIIQNDRRGNKQSSYQPPHSADECPLRENPAQMISVLQTLNNELTSYPMREIVHSSRLIRVALRKAMIECALHQSGAGISMNGSIISSFHFPAERLQRAVNPQSQNTKPSHSPSLLLSHQPGLNNSSTGRGKRRRANSVLDCTPTRNELSTPLQPSSASNDGRPLEVSAATGQSFSHGYHQGENSSFQFDLDEYQRQDDWSEHKHRRQKQHSITIDNKTLPVRIHAPMYTIDVINNQDKQTDAANALPAYSNHHSFAEEDFEEDYCDPESEYLKFLSSLSAFVQMNNGTSNNEDELLLDDEEDCTDILNDDEEEEEEDPLEEYRDDPDVLVSDSELRELFEDEELEDMQNWAPAEENQKLLVFDNRQFSDQSLAEFQNQLNQLFQLALQGYAASQDIDEKDDQVTATWKLKIMDLVTQFSDKTFLSAQLKSNLKKSARLIATIKPSQEPCLTSLKNAIGENLDNSIFKELQLSNRQLKLRRFSDAENRLLTIGIYHYGSSNVDFIREFLLPNRTENQLLHRWRNLIRRRAEDNPAKSLYFSMQKPLTATEEKMLNEACAEHGYNFIRISKHFVKSKSPAFLRSAWHLMKNQKRK